MEYVRRGLRSKPKKVESAYGDELKADRERIGELVLQIEVLKKQGGCYPRELVLRISALMEKEGKRASPRRVAGRLEVSCSTVQYNPRRRRLLCADTGVSR